MERKKRRQKRGEKKRKSRILSLNFFEILPLISKTSVDAPEEANLLWNKNKDLMILDVTYK